MRILGVDPGFRIAGFGIVERDGQRALLLDHGFLQLSASDSLSRRVGCFYDFFSQKISAYRVDAIALETPFLGKNAQNFLKLGYLRGLLYLLADQHGAQLLEFAPREIKRAVAGFGAADKQRVAAMVMRFFPSIDRPRHLDVTDALAVALCGLWASRSGLSLV